MALIFFDIDGTLWDENMQIPDGTIETLKQVQQNDLMEYWRRVVIMWNWMGKLCMRIFCHRS